MLDEQRLSFRTAFRGRVNTEHDQIYRNVRAAIRRQLPQVQPHAPNGYKVALLCSGPSLAGSEARVRSLARNGWKFFTVNGTHAWLQAVGVDPSMHAQLDARAFNWRFVSKPAASCRYLICSQCDPAVFNQLAGHDVHLWHGASPDLPEAKILDRFYLGRWTRVPGGGSVGTRAIGLAYILGVRRLRVFGMDGCLVAGEHHAFEQQENDADEVKVVRVGRRKFRAHMWMLSQLDDCLQMLGHVPDDMDLAFEGEGLIAHVIAETARRGKPPKITLE